MTRDEVFELSNEYLLSEIDLLDDQRRQLMEQLHKLRRDYANGLAIELIRSEEERVGDTTELKLHE